MLEDLSFESFEFNLRKEIITGLDTTGQYFIKIEVIKNKNKLNNIKQEYEIIKHLNDLECRTCPKAYEYGLIKKTDIYSKVEEKDILDSAGKEEFQYIIQDFIPDNKEQNLADIVLSIIEQKKLGVYQADIKPANIRFDSEKSLCYLIDYDQSVFLDEEQKELDNTSFLNFCSEHDKNRHGFGNWLRHFPQFTENDVVNLFKDNAFDLGQTAIFNIQNTTNTVSGIYHTINEKDVFIDGSRTLGVRARLLDNVEFLPNERVLDVGCNSGLLSVYTHDRGCHITGVDNDPHIIFASKIVSNILGKSIDYYHLDLDEVTELEDYDTILLFSVLHHTKNPLKNAKKIANSCSRIILETRLTETGKQPVDGVWTHTSNWSFETVAELVSFCEDMFTGFKLKTNLGRADKNRYMFEFVK